MTDPVSERLERMSPLQRAVFALKETQARLDAIERRQNEPIAIVGMACRFPGGANDPESFWRLMCEGVEAIREIPPDRWDVDAYFDPDPTAPGKMNTRWGGFLDRIDEFDNHFFGISDQEAARIDPQQRMLLELAWESLEDAGLPPRSLRGTRTGVFVGISASDYAVLMCVDGRQTDGYAAAGTSLCLAANRISFAFDWHGPSMAIDTACSSSVVAVHLACQNLRHGECEMALACGANVLLSPAGMVNLTKAGISSPDGKVRSFDAAASGYVRSEGAGVLVLKPLSAALKNRDRIRAVILSTAVNQNGTSNGQTAPSRAAQERVLREAYARAKVSPGQIQFVETQGTATRLGDAIEALALGTVLAEGREPGSRCVLGAVKTNLGHLEAAAGVAGVIKTALALEHRQIPPNLHFHAPNPDIPFDRLPLRVARELEPWPRTAGPRLAGVSAFGFGGSNAHVVLQEAPESESATPSADGPRTLLLPISARTEKALRDFAAAYRALFHANPPAWRDVCYTAARRRDHHDCRLAVLADSCQQAAELLADFLDREPAAASSGTWIGSELSGAGIQRPLPPEAKDGSANQRRVAIGRRPYGRDLKVAFLFGDLAVDRPKLVKRQGELAAWWRSIGVIPEIVLGWGAGELAAACAAGILTTDEAWRLAADPTSAVAVPGPATREASLPFVSAVDGKLHRGQDLAASHWRRALESRDGWTAALAALRDRKIDVCLQLGPGQKELDVSGWTNAEGQGVLVLATSASGADPEALWTVARLYAAGADIRWEHVAPDDGRCVRLPTYPWQRQRLWAVHRDALAHARQPRLPATESPAPGRQDSPGEGPGAGAVGVDRQNVRRRPDLIVPYVAPRTEVESQIAQAWMSVLRLDRVGIHDNFFELGGDSLQVTILLNRLRERLGVAIALREVYETPTIARLAECVAAAGKASQEGDVIPRVPRDGLLLPSLTQEALWFLDQLERERPTYTIYSPIRVRGRLDVALAERALNEIARRHEILRTTFPEVDGRPMARIAPPEHRPLPVIDLRHLADDERRAALHRGIREEMDRPVDLQKGPLIRITLFRLADEEHVAVLSTHHIIYDGWSMAVLLRELTALYGAYAAGQPSPLEELPIQYADFAAWQRNRLRGERLESLRDYWRKQLTGVAPLALPTDHPRPAVRTTRGAVHAMHLSPRTAAAVAEFCRREGLTPFMVFLAALEVLLRRYGGQDDFAVGTPVANRTRPETEALIGYFVNVLVLRAKLSGSPAFREILERVRQTTLEAYEHQDMTLDQVVEAVNPPRDLGRHPLFQVMFALQNFELAATEQFGLTLSPLEDGPVSRQSFFDLTLELWPVGATYRADWYFATDLFRAATIERMAAQFERLVAEAVARPDCPIGDLPLLDEAERHRLIVELNDTARDYPKDRCIHELFEARAAAVPEAPAVVLGDARWTYRELNERSNQLARLLKDEGVGPEVRVGICLDRSPELWMAVLGVLKAGGAYVPLDPTHAREATERNAFVLRESGVSLIVTCQRLANSLDGGDIRRIVLDGDAATRLRAQSTENLPKSASAENLAYVLYTSGSTGRPKGVMVTHRNLVNAYYGWEAAYGLGGEPALSDGRGGPRSHLQMASFAFDVFAGDTVRALCSGGKLVVCPKEILLDPARLIDLMRREEVDIAEFVPVVFRELIQYAEQHGESLGFFRLAIVGSDAWYAADHRRARRVLGSHARLVNSYGLTETTIDSSYFEGEVDSLADTALVPIGRPFANVRLYVLDERRQPAPVGVPGELYIGGDGVSRGYVNAELNAERFLPDPFGGHGARLFRTGDRARWRPDGQLEFLGRADDQVKIRGFRIEPSEVEQCLREHPKLAEAAVVVRQRTAGDPRLVAYVVGKNGSPPDLAETRRFLGQRLPDYMIPSAVVALERMPLTNSGKIDRQALPDPDWNRASLCGEFIAPRTELEEKLAAIWGEVLGVQRVGVEDNFFDLGGSSLLALRLTSRLRSALGVDLPLAALFTSPTVAGLAAAIENLSASGGRSESVAPADPLRLFDAFVLHGYGEAEAMAGLRAAAQSPGQRRSLVPLRPGGGEPPLFCVHGLGGHVACFLPLARALSGTRPVYGFQGQGLEADEEPHDSIEAMASLYTRELQEAQPHGPYLLCGWSLGGLIALEMAQKLAAQGQATALVALLDSYLSTKEFENLDLDDRSVIRWIAPHLGLSLADLKRLPVEQQWELIAQRANVAQGIGVAEIRRLAAVCRAHLAAAGRYRPRPYGGRVVLFRAGRVSGMFDGQWRALCPDLEVERIPGDHYSILRQPDVAALAERLDQRIRAVLETQRSQTQALTHGNPCPPRGNGNRETQGS